MGSSFCKRTQGNLLCGCTLYIRYHTFAVSDPPRSRAQTVALSTTMQNSIHYWGRLERKAFVLNQQCEHERQAAPGCYTLPQMYILSSFCPFSNLSVTSPTTQLILQPPSLSLRHSSFSNPSFATPTSQALHLIHLASRPRFKTSPCHAILILRNVFFRTSRFPKFDGFWAPKR